VVVDVDLPYEARAVSRQLQETRLPRRQRPLYRVECLGLRVYSLKFRVEVVVCDV